MVCRARKQRKTKMKKLIIASIAVIIGLVSNAATVDWSVQITSSATSYASGYTVYLVNASAWDAAAISADIFSNTSVVLDSTTFNGGAGKGANKTYTTMDATGATNARSVNVASLDAGSSMDVYYVIVNKSADPNTYYKWSDSLTGREESGSESIGGNWKIAGDTINSGTWTAVPEPTSGLLMLLGMAGLALRRRV